VGPLRSGRGDDAAGVEVLPAALMPALIALKSNPGRCCVLAVFLVSSGFGHALLLLEGVGYGPKTESATKAGELWDATVSSRNSVCDDRALEE